MKYLDLFTGYGGFTLGVQQVMPKAECIGFSEIDSYAIQTYQKHFPNHQNYGDITKIKPAELPDFDLLTGGFPCQAFSIAGKRKGFDDTRGTLFFDIARIIKEKRPKYILLENVKGLISHNGGKTLETILLTLQELGYYVNIEVCNAKDFGVPQNRERIFLLCKHIKTILNDGQTEITNISKDIIQQYLFQLLLNNLKEVKKLQERNLKDSVIGYLLLKEINQNLNPSGKNIMAGIMMDTVGSIFQSREGEAWQNIDIWLSKRLGVNLKELNKSTILTAISQTIKLKTYTHSKTLEVILYAIVLWKKSLNNSWKEMLSNLIVFQENTNYARINEEIETAIITENGSAYISKDFQKIKQRHFIVGHLRGEPRPKVFPVGKNDEISNEQNKSNERRTQTKFSATLKAAGNIKADDTFIVHNVYGGFKEKKVREFHKTSPTIRTPQGGGHIPMVVEDFYPDRIRTFKESPTIRKDRQGLKVAIPVLTPDRLNKSQNGRRMKTNGEPMFTLTGQDRHGIYDKMKIRRLTPLECERLMGLPDNWTEGVSDSQRYKLCGNGLVVPVVKEIIKRLIN